MDRESKFIKFSTLDSRHFISYLTSRIIQFKWRMYTYFNADFSLVKYSVQSGLCWDLWSIAFTAAQSGFSLYPLANSVLLSVICFNWEKRLFKDHCKCIFYRSQSFSEFLAVRCKTLLIFIFVIKNERCDFILTAFWINEELLLDAINIKRYFIFSLKNIRRCRRLF